MRSRSVALLVAVVALAAHTSLAAPKIIEGLQSTATPAAGSSGGAVQSPLAEDPADLFFDDTPLAELATEAGPSVWDMPALQAQVMHLRQAGAVAFQQQKLADAEARFQQSVALIPHDPAGHYLLACAQARQGKSDAALASLTQAVHWGFNQSAVMDRDANFASLQGKLAFARLIAEAKSAQRPKSPWRHRVIAATPVDGTVYISASNTAWDMRSGIYLSLLKPVAADSRVKEPLQGGSELATTINRWYAEGTAAGNTGDFYDNHDNDHSLLSRNIFTQMTEIEWDDATKQRGLHTGLQVRFMFNGIVIGNSSTALVNNPFWRSQPRLAYANARSAAILAAQYTKNHLYFYPEHADHDVNYGDVYPANTPYVIISQGSSGSDVAFMEAFMYSLAALRPDVKAQLAKHGALMPALQMCFRMTQRSVAVPEDYLTGAAHSTVFDSHELQTSKMVTMAHDLTVDNLPPLVRLKVVEDDASVPGVDYFDVGPRQELFTTPAAIARVHRTSKFQYRMVVSAEQSVDLNGLPLTYHWKLLRGDDTQVKIKPLTESGSIAELIVPFHAKRPISFGSNMSSNRVDIGCFVHNGQHYSAPGFVTFYTLANERRMYHADLRPKGIKYSVGGDYVDPMIDIPKSWIDEYEYQNNELTGWTRLRGEAKEAFTADGALVIARDEVGRPLTARTVKYVASQPAEGALPTLTQQPGDELLHYVYDSQEDKVGMVVRREKVAK